MFDSFLTDASPSEVAFAGGVLGGVFAFTLTLASVFYILLLIGGWKVFVKAGEKGWKVLIPIYNVYIFYKIVGMKKWFWAMIIAAFAVGLIAGITGQGTQLDQIALNTTNGILVVALLIAMSVFDFIISVVYAVRTSKAFGHGGLFALGLFFLSGLFLLILGFGKSKYNKKLVKSWE